MGLGLQTIRVTATYSMAAILGKLAGFLMLPFYAHIFDAEGYGVIGMIDASLGILTVLFIGGFSTGIMRVYHEQSRGRKKLALSTGVQVVAGLSLAVVILPILFSGSISRLLFGRPDYYPLICLSLVTFVLDVSSSSASTYLLINQKAVFYSLIGFSRLILGLFLNIWLVVILRVGLIGIFISGFVTAFMAFCVFFVTSARANGMGFDREIAIQLLKFQLPLIPGDLISFIGRQSERILVRILISLEGVGVLEMAYKFPPLLRILLANPFMMAWRTKSLEIANGEGSPAVISRIFTIYFFFLVFGGLIMAVTIENVLVLLTPQSFWGAAYIAKVEIITTILAALTNYVSFGLIYQKETRILSYVKSAVTPVKIALSFTMIHTWGLVGAAYSALIAEVITFTWIFHKSQGFYRIPIEYGKIGIIVVGAVALFLALNGNVYQNFAPAVYVREHILPALAVFIDLIPLGERKTGKVLQMMQAKSEAVVALGINAFLSLCFLGVIPFLWWNEFRSYSRKCAYKMP